MPKKNKAAGRELAADHARTDAIDSGRGASVTASIGGAGEAFETRLVGQVATAGAGHKSGDDYWEAAEASTGALAAMAPQTPVEAVLNGLFLALSDVTMECIERANLVGQPEAVRAMNLKFAFKGAALAPQLAEAMDKCRTASNPPITVGQVNVHAGGQAIVGHVQAPSRSGADDQAETLSAMKPARRIRRNPANA